MARAWPDTVVEESNLKVQIAGRREKQMVLVLDNYEDVIKAAAAMASAVRRERRVSDHAAKASAEG